jgi:hypothetical protein
MSAACHNPQGQVACATPNYLFQEVVCSDVPWRDDVVIGPVGMRASSGTRHMEVHETEAAKHPFQPEVTMACLHRDGSVADCQNSRRSAHHLEQVLHSGDENRR